MAFAAKLSIQHLQLKQLPVSCYSKPEQRPSSFSLLRGHILLSSNGKINFTSSRKINRHQHYRKVPRVNAETAPVQEEEEDATSSRPALTPEEEDEANCREILRVLDVLKEKRDMPFNEVRLILMIEDPREEEEREEMGIENERGCSREEMAAALVDVYEGRIPSDRVVLRELTKEMVSWPNLEEEADSSGALDSPYAQITDTGVDRRVAAQRQKVDWDEAAEIEPGQEADDPNVPPVVGFSVLYLVSSVPIIIGAAVITILFLNSFR